MDPTQKVILFQWPKVSYRLCWEKPYQKVISKVWINPLIPYPERLLFIKSGATQLLGMAMENALDQKLNRYLNKSFWQELGAEKEALWQVDRKKRGTEKFLCCFASNARDFAHFINFIKTMDVGITLNYGILLLLRNLLGHDLNLALNTAMVGG